MLILAMPAMNFISEPMSKVVPFSVFWFTVLIFTVGSMHSSTSWVELRRNLQTND